jgi:hypothetical protein
MPKLNEYHHCTAQARDGSFCDAPAIEEAPFPICIEHAAMVLRFLRGYIDAVESAPLELRMLILDRTRDKKAEAARDAAVEKRSLVYYVQLGDLIKIGYTANFSQRMKNYPPHRRVLAVERGNMRLEEQRHRQFRAHLAEGNEWFRPAPDLIEHINRLRKKAGVALISRVA